MSRTSVVFRTSRTTGTVAATSVAALLLSTVAACGSSSKPAASSTTGTDVTATATPSADVATSTEASDTPTTTPESSSTPSAGTTSSPLFSTPATPVARSAQAPSPITNNTTITIKPTTRSGADTGLGTDDQGAVTEAYTAYLQNVSGYYGTFQKVWLDAVQEVTTPRLFVAVAKAAAVLSGAKEHTINVLKDTKLVVTVAADKKTATITDCLDELHWYPIKTATGKVDPTIGHGYFVSKGIAVKTKGQWYIDQWAPQPTMRCTPGKR